MQPGCPPPIIPIICATATSRTICRKARWSWPARRLKLADVKIPIYNLAAKEDHIAPARSAYIGGKLFGGNVTYVMAGSGPYRRRGQSAAAGKYQFWTGWPQNARLSKTGSPAPPKRRAPGGRTGMNGSARAIPMKKSPPGNPAARNSSRSRMRPVPMSGSGCRQLRRGSRPAPTGPPHRQCEICRWAKPVYPPEHEIRQPAGPRHSGPPIQALPVRRPS
jgi:hypothetical protein